MFRDRICYWIACLLIPLGLLACSDANPDAPSENSIHAAVWTVDHSLEADITSCTVCHGPDYRGGGAAVSCYKCHYDGPPFGVHPGNWADAYVDHRNFVGANGFISCATSACHGAAPFVQGGMSAPSCGSSGFTNKNGATHGCHTGHISGANWLLPAAHAASAIANAAGCWGCHDLTAQVDNNPACRDCHTVKSPNYVQGTCDSCHNNPPNSGEHAKHVGEEGFGCRTCHVGYGTNSLGHWYTNPNPPADVAFNFTGDLQIQPGFSYNGGSCTGTCHGEGHSQESW